MLQRFNNKIRMKDQFLKVDTSKRILKGHVKMIGFKEGDFEIVYLPSLGISGYGNTVAEAQELIKISIQAFADDLFKLEEYQIFKELEQLGWKQQKIFKKQLRNLSPTTFEDIKREFNIPDNTPITETSISV